MKRQGTGSFNDGRTISAKGDASGVTGHVNSNVSGLFRNPKTINSTVTISSDENAVMAGPVEISSTGSLTVNGTLVIV